MPVDNNYLWRACSSRHDWRDHRLAERWLAFLADQGLIGPIEWTDVDESGKVATAKYGADYLAFLHDQEKVIQKADFFTMLEFGGQSPQKWACFIALFPYAPGEGVAGMNSMQVTMTKESFPSDPSDIFWIGLQRVHDSDNTEYAIVHSYTEYHQLKEQAYRAPITVSVLFDGVFWANFLDRAYLDQFRMDQVQKQLSNDFITLTDKQGGLFFRLKDSLLAVTEKEVTERMKRMSRVFRKALSPSSKWR